VRISSSAWSRASGCSFMESAPVAKAAKSNAGHCDFQIRPLRSATRAGTGSGLAPRRALPPAMAGHQFSL
jgi:hypothetical protein